MSPSSILASETLGLQAMNLILIFFLLLLLPPPYDAILVLQRCHPPPPPPVKAPLKHPITQAGRQLLD
jgi:hypothetical protein